MCSGLGFVRCDTQRSAWMNVFRPEMKKYDIEYGAIQWFMNNERNKRLPQFPEQSSPNPQKSLDDMVSW